MAINNENISDHITALSQLDKIEVEPIEPPPNNDNMQPRDGLTTSPSSEDAGDTLILHRGNTSGKNHQDPISYVIPLGATAI